MEYEIGEDESVCTAIVLAVSSVEDCDPCSLTPLYEAIDPEALTALFDSKPATSSTDPITVTFTFSAYLITVTDGASLTLRPANSPTQ
ncbi:HalOD1 output domain-containing protein [Natrinema sp. H-ect4]|uniref:HalOD1 output domain-containing protein n=1 Tax=Natrinema sp. H-ect4 TaxID=3242699 RepID=UPI0035A985EB